MELKAYGFGADLEDVRPPRRVRVGLIQNTIVLPTSDPVTAQRDALLNKIGQIIGVAHDCGVNIVCLQEAWSNNYSYVTIWNALTGDLLVEFRHAICLLHTGKTSMVPICGICRKRSDYVISSRGSKLPTCHFRLKFSLIAIKQLAKRYNMVILSPILERDEDHGDTIWNTCVVISNTGKIIGKSRKNHIPRVGDFNESTYYMESNLGHPVFEVRK